MKFNFDTVYDRHNTNSVKYDFMQVMEPRASKDDLAMWIADMDFKATPEISQALADFANTGFFGYSKAQDGYYEAALRWYQKRFNWDIIKSTVHFSPGIVPGIAALINLLTDEGDGVIIQPPVYYPFQKIINGNKRVVVENKLINDDGYYTIDFADLREKASQAKTKVMILCSPHNPVGRVWKKEELEEVARIASATNTYLITDEIHCDLLRKGVKHYPMHTLLKPEAKDRVITLTAPSKTFNIPGLQMSLVIIENEELGQRYDQYLDAVTATNNMNAMGIVGAKAAYEHGEEWLDEVLAYIDENFKYFQEGLKTKAPKAKIWIPEGTYLGWLDLSAYGNNEIVMEKLLEIGKLFIEDGTVFGDGGEGYFRINLAAPRAIIDDCLNRLEKTFK